MTNVVYVIGNGAAKSDNMPLRWSLRSLAKHAKNVGSVIVAGVVPEWLSDEVVKVPCDTVSQGEGGKEWNILNGIKEANKVLPASAPYLFSSDDHYFLPGHGGILHDLDAWPRYFTGKIPTQTMLIHQANARGEIPGLYQWSLARTRAMLEKAKLPVRRACVHLNTWQDPQDVAAALELLDKYRKVSRHGYVLDVVFNAFYEKRMNEAGLVPEFVLYKHDAKVATPADLDRKIKLGCPQFSTGEKGERNPELVKLMNEMYAEPCRWEKSAPAEP